MTRHDVPQAAEADATTALAECDKPEIKLLWSVHEAWDRGMWQSSRSHLVSRTATLLGCMIGDLQLDAADTGLAVDAATIEWARAQIQEAE